MFGIDRDLIRGIMLGFLIMPFLWVLAVSLVKGDFTSKSKAETKKHNGSDFLISILGSILLWKFWNDK